MNDPEYEDAELERYSLVVREARSLGYAVPLRKRPPAPFVPTDPLPGVCHACGTRDVQRFIGAGTYLPVCSGCLA